MRPLVAHCHHGLGTLYATSGQREQARTAALDGYGDVPVNGDDLLAAPGGGGTGAGGIGTGQEVAAARRCQEQETQDYGRLRL